MNPATMNPQGPLVRHPLAPHQFVDELTPEHALFTLCHLGVAQLDAQTWRLRVDGMVRRPLELSLADLRALPRTEFEAIHQCQGSPMDPHTPTRRIANVRWSGVRLESVLEAAQPLPGARFAWCHGADHGALGPAHCDAYVKDLPLERIARDVLLATALNGAPLSAEHGYPVRVVVPGFYGTNSVKWVTRIELAEARAPGLFTTRFYNDPVIGDDGRETGERVPVWAIAPESVIVSPAPDDTLRAGNEATVWGRAWADEGVARAEVSMDGGVTWQPADLQARAGHRWQRFSLRWRPSTPGEFTLMSRAFDPAGRGQPPAGRRNAVHAVAVRVI